MKVAESWLRHWVDPDLGLEALAERLTMAGHEVEGIETQGKGLDGVVVGAVLGVETHPEADRLSICRVDGGGKQPVDVVCGAPNVVAGMKAALAMPGAILPGDFKLKKTKIRGVVSNGMLCSAAELALGDDADGIIALPGDAVPGMPLADYLGLPDKVLDVNLTPNRGDCFSILGVARDVAALTGTDLRPVDFPAVRPTLDEVLPVEVEEPAGCPSFAGQVVRGIDPTAKTPLWMAERLRRSGLRPIHPVVDITNYVMLELGQPLHAYDLDKVRGAIRPRLARSGEKVVLLDEKEVEINTDTLVITDDSGVIGLAGIMGGLGTAVTADTVDVFFEGAFWTPEYMAGRARAYGLHTDASLRFERGVDPAGQARAVERATGLLLEIAGGEAGPLSESNSDDHLPARRAVHLRHARLDVLLGINLEAARIESILDRLGMKLAPVEDGWTVVAPSYRFDIELEVDLIEEVARVYGYDAIPERTEIVAIPLPEHSESSVDIDLAAGVLVGRDYREVVTYSFVDRQSNQLLTGIDSPLVLENPISQEMAVMRSSLWPGLLKAVGGNLARQQDRVRIFEIGKSFHGEPGEHVEVTRIAAAVTGSALPEQWATKAQSVDFFDIKGDVEAILALSGGVDRVRFRRVDHPALQPGQAAEILREDEVLGVVGKLHPRHARALELKRDVYLFELDAVPALASAPPRAEAVSRYPSIRRDIAVVVDESVSSQALVEAVLAAAPGLISGVRIFDVYQGAGIEAGRKSIALGLILQETSRTLTDVDADSAMAAAVKKLKKDFAAELRE
ncbi:MAG: phenylalanine--tRNA ligase subunit beta [Woeseiaceae bacterium]|nr:phenylalanine--tRNA ligase subunit beta [Woeseiaceae bacterium]